MKIFSMLGNWSESSDNISHIQSIKDLPVSGAQKNIFLKSSPGRSNKNHGSKVALATTLNFILKINVSIIAEWYTNYIW